MSTIPHQDKQLWIGRPPSSKREQILACAQHVFAEGGFHQTEVQSISDRTGISKATIYKIFHSKDNLLVEMINEVMNHLGELALRAVAGTEPPVQRLENGAAAMLNFAESNRELFEVIFRDGSHHLKEVSEVYEQSLKRFQPAIEPLFEAARADGYFRGVDTGIVLDTALACLLGQFSAWLLLHNGRGKLVETGMRTMRALVNGMSKPDDRLD